MSSVNSSNQATPFLITYVDRNSDEGIATYIETFEKALSVNPHNDYAKNNLENFKQILPSRKLDNECYAHLNNNRIDLALNCINELKEKYPNYPNLSRLEGLYFYKVANYEQAAKFLKEDYSNSNDKRITLYLGVSLYKLAVQKKDDALLYEAEKLLLKHRECGELNLEKRESTLAIIYKMTFRYSKAIIILEQLTPPPKGADFYILELAEIYLAINQHDKAKAKADKVSEKFKLSDHYLCFQACYFIKKRSLDELSKFIKEFPESKKSVFLPIFTLIQDFLSNSHASQPLKAFLNEYHKSPNSIFQKTALFIEAELYAENPLEYPKEWINSLADYTGINIKVDLLYLINLFQNQRYTEIVKYLVLMTQVLPVEQCKTLPEFTPSISKLYLLLALAHFFENRPKESLRILEPLSKMTLYPSHRNEIADLLIYLNKHGLIENLKKRVDGSEEISRCFELIIKFIDTTDTDIEDIKRLLGTKKVEDANQALRKLIVLKLKTEDRVEEIQFLLGRCYYILGQNEKAIEALKKYICIKNDPEARYLLGRIYQKMQKLSQALEQFLIHKSLQPKHFKIEFRIGEIYLDMGRVGMSVRVFSELHDLTPKNDNVINFLILAALAVDNFNAALLFLNKLSDQRNKDFTSSCLRAYVYVMLDRKEELQKLLSTHSFDKHPHIIKGFKAILNFFNRGNKNIDKCLGELRKILEKNPQSRILCVSYLNLAQKYDYKLNSEDPVLIATANSPDLHIYQFVDALYVECLFKEKKYKQLIDFVNKRYKYINLQKIETEDDITINVVRCFLMKSLAYAKLNNFSSAIAIQKVLIAMPKNYPLKESLSGELGSNYYFNGDYKECIEIVKEGYLNSSEKSLMYIISLLRTKAFDDAVNALKKAISKYPDVEEINGLIKELPEEYSQLVKKNQERKPIRSDIKPNLENPQPSEQSSNRAAVLEEEARMKALREADQARLVAEQQRIEAKNKGEILSADMRNRYRTEVSIPQATFVEDEEGFALDILEESALLKNKGNEEFSYFNFEEFPDMYPTEAVNTMARYHLFGIAGNLGSGLIPNIATSI